MKILRYIALALLIALPVHSQEGIQNAQEFEKQFTFKGAWLPDFDPIQIGPENYKTLKNLRYKSDGIGLEGVAGYTGLNSTALSTYLKIRSAGQLKTLGRTVESYVLTQAENSGETASVVWQNQTAIPGTGDFESTALHTDASGAGLGRFATGALESIAYCNGVETMIWAGEESRVATFFAMQNDDYDNPDFTNPIEYTEEINNSLTSTGETVTLGVEDEYITNGNMESNSDWSNDNSASSETQTTDQEYSGNYSWSFIVDGQDQGIRSASFETVAATTYYYSVWVRTTTTSVNVRIRNGADDANSTDYDHTVTANTWTLLTGNYTESAGKGGSDAYFSVRSPTGVSSGTWYVDDVSVTATGRRFWFVMTTQPIQGVKYTVNTSNTVSSRLDVEYWNGSWTDVSNLSDGTSDASQTALENTGTVSFDSTVSDAKPFHFEGRFLYAYLFHLTGGNAEISQVSVDAPFQDLKDIWDGVDRQPTSFVVWRNGVSKPEDFTLEVNEASPLADNSDIRVLYGAVLDAFMADSGDYLIVTSDDRLSGIYWDIVSYLPNASASTVSINYWDGDAYTSVGTVTDNTQNSAGTTSLYQSGLMSWDPPAEYLEKRKTEFGVTGYSYKLTWSAQLTGTYGEPSELAVDVVTLVPAQKEVLPFTFPATFNDRYVFCDYAKGNERNRCDFTETGKPNVLNGAESSDDGLQSFYFGDSEPVTAAREIYNKYGSRVITKFAAFKSNKIFVVEGKTVEDMLNGISIVSENIGCAAPLTLASIEVGYEVAEGLERNVLIFVDTTGVYSFDGENVKPLKGIDKYFDPDDDDCINFDYIEKAEGIYDPIHKEYNLIIPSGSSQTTNNVWLVYNLQLKRWYEKDPSPSEFPQTIFKVQDTDGANYTYGSIDTGYMMRLENGTTWNDGTTDSAIEQVVETGDFYPTGNSWNLTRLRGVKIIAKRIDEAHQIIIGHQSDTDDVLGMSGVWVNWSGGKWMDWSGGKWVNASLGNAQINLTDSLNRVVRKTLKDSLFGWTHRLKFTAQTSDTEKGFQPIGWAIWGKVEDRRDDD